MADEGMVPLAISMGEPAGVGPDLILQLYANREAHGLPAFAVYGNLGFLASRARRLGLDIAFEAADITKATEIFPTALPVVHVDGLVPDKPGEATPLSGRVVTEAIRRAVADTLRGACRGLVTAPIHKGALYAAGFSHPGHTEFLATLCARNGVTPHPVMMLAANDLRVVPATVHVPLAAVPSLVTQELLERTGRIVAHDLRTRFEIDEPRIVFTGLNPHAGEGGTIGKEDLDIVAPAVAQLVFETINAEGPVSADTIFHPPHWRAYDAVIAMYHDQALIPIKTVAFDEGVNVTLGLPIVGPRRITARPSTLPARDALPAPACLRPSGLRTR